MNKADLIGTIASSAGVSKADVERVLDAMIGVVAKEVSRGGRVSIMGFGTFSASRRAARIGRNPKTGGEIRIRACTIPKFKPSLSFKAAVAVAPSLGDGV